MLSLSWGLQLVGRPVIPRLPLLLVVLWVLLVPIQCFQDRPKWHYVSSEVVILRKVTYQGKGFQAPGRLSYSLRFRGQRHIIHLRRKKLIWPRHLLLTTQDDQGALQMDYPFFPADCYYSGYLEEVPQSMVTVDTCDGGLDGVLMFDDLAYEIKPLNDSHRFEHYISQIVVNSDAVGPMNSWKHMVDNTGPLFSAANSNVAPRISSRDYASHPAAIKGHFQSTFLVYSVVYNVDRICKYLFSLASLMDTYLSHIHVRYYVILLTVYNNGDPFAEQFNVPGGAPHTYYLNNFYYRHKPDQSTIIYQHGPNELTFHPVPFSICTPNGLSIVGKSRRPYIMISAVVANRVGRNLGLPYDDEKYCVCQRRTTCMMFRMPLITDAFSNCSLLHINEIISTPGVMPCLYHDTHTYYNKSHTYIFCGNFKVDESEKCDCGSYKACYADACCKSDCTFTTGSICAKEPCCLNCTYSPAGTLCRPIQNICDLPEYCTGRSLDCPADTYLQDGTPCSEEGYCFKGNCTDRSIQCKEIFGLNARKADQKCYDINKERFRFGHCWRQEESLRFTPCKNDQDKMCGRLQCTNVTHLPRLQDHVSFHQSIISGFTCFGLDEHRSTDTVDVGHVRYGTPCSQTSFCDRGSCNGSLYDLDYDCTPEKCNFRGVCNNHRNCYCHVGWDPPNCVGDGPGGSTDSGPIPRKMRRIKQSPEPVVYLRTIASRIYAIIVALLFGAAIRVAVIKIISFEELQAALLRRTPGTQK